MRALLREVATRLRNIHLFQTTNGKCKCKTHSIAIRTQFTPLPNIYAEARPRLYFCQIIFCDILCILLCRIYCFCFVHFFFFYSANKRKRNALKEKENPCSFPTPFGRSDQMDVFFNCFAIKKSL